MAFGEEACGCGRGAWGGRQLSPARFAVSEGGRWRRGSRGGRRGVTDLEPQLLPAHVPPECSLSRSSSPWEARAHNNGQFSASSKTRVLGASFDERWSTSTKQDCLLSPEVSGPPSVTGWPLRAGGPHLGRFQGSRKQKGTHRSRVSVRQTTWFGVRIPGPPLSLGTVLGSRLNVWTPVPHLRRHHRPHAVHVETSSGLRETRPLSVTNSFSRGCINVMR